MKKHTSDKTKQLIALMAAKTLLISVGAVLLYSFLLSEVIYRLDLSLDNAKFFSLIVAGFAAITISFLSCLKIKSNGVLLGILSEIPLVFYCLMNLIFNDTNVLLFFIKLLIIMCCGALGGLLAVKKSRKIKV